MTPQACGRCRKFRRKCDGNKPCNRCMEENQQCSDLSQHTQQRRNTYSTDLKRCLVKHQPSQAPTDTSASKQRQYCKSSLPCSSLGSSDFIVRLAFIPGRTVVNHHCFSDVLKHHDTCVQRFMIPALMTLYTEQIGQKRCDARQRYMVDAEVIRRHRTVCGRGTLALNDLHFILIANQYIFSIPMMFTSSGRFNCYLRLLGRDYSPNGPEQSCLRFAPTGSRRRWESTETLGSE